METSVGKREDHTCGSILEVDLDMRNTARAHQVEKQPTWPKNIAGQFEIGGCFQEYRAPMSKFLGTHKT